MRRIILILLLATAFGAVLAPEALGQQMETREQQLARDDLIAQESMARSTEGLFLLTAVQLLVGVIGTIAVLGSLEMTRRSLAHSTAATKQSEEAVKLSRKALTHQEQTSKQQLRAYLSVTPIVHDVEEGKRPHVQLKIFNHGQTPAYKARTSLALRYRSAGPDVKFSSAMEEYFPPVIIQPGHKSGAKRTLKEVLTKEMVLEISNEKNGEGYVLDVIGRVEYEDAFGEARFTDFGYFFFGKDGGKNMHIPHMNLAN